MLRLPPELLNTVCSYLHQSKDVPTFRLVSKQCADTGFRHLVTVVALHTEKNSLDRLAALSKDKELSQHVRHLFWATTVLDTNQVLNFRDWFSEASEYMTHLGNLIVKSPRPSTRAQWIAQWRKYKTMVAEQISLSKEKLDERAIHESMSSFTGLQKVTISCGDAYLKPIEDLVAERMPGYHEEHPFVEALQMPVYERTSARRDMIHILSGLALSGSKISKFRGGGVHWTVLEQTSEEMFRLAEPLSSLLSFHLHLECNDGYDEAADCARCYKYLQTHDSFHVLLRRMPKLRSLHLKYWKMTSGPPGFEYQRQYPARLENTFPDNVAWPNLRKLSFGGCEATSSQLLAVVKTCRYTLDILGFENIRLDGPGDSWLRLLPQIRGITRLKCADIYGLLETINRDRFVTEAWFANREDWNEGPRQRFNGLRDRIDDYFVHGGPMPLTREGMFRDEEFPLFFSCDHTN